MNKIMKADMRMQSLPGLECVSALPGNVNEELGKVLGNVHSFPVGYNNDE